MVVTVTAAWGPGRSARAAGVEHPDVGTIAIGRGGAYAADPDGGLALQYNPAGFAWQDGLRATFDASLAWQRVTFAPAGGGAPVSNGAPPFFAPAAVASFGLGRVGPLAALTFALGASGPAAIGKLSYPAGGAQRYALISSDTTIVYWSAAVAAAFNRWLAAGVTLQLVKGTARFTQAVWTGASSGTNPAEDAIAHVDVTSGFIPTAVLGVTARPTARVSLGVSYRPRFTFDASGSLTTDLPTAAGALAARQVGTSTGFTLPMPDVVRAGVLVRPRARWLVEADVVLERWSTLRSLALLPHGISLESDNLGTSKPLPNIVFQKNFDDAVSVRVGGERDLLGGRLTVRAGYLHETSAVPLASTSVDFPNWDRDVVAVGASIAIPRAPLAVDVAYAHHFLPARTVASSGITQVVTPCLTPGCADPAAVVVGNGRYGAALDVLSFSLRFALPARGSLTADAMLPSLVAMRAPSTSLATSLAFAALVSVSMGAAACGRPAARRRRRRDERRGRQRRRVGNVGGAGDVVVTISGTAASHPLNVLLNADADFSMLSVAIVDPQAVLADAGAPPLGSMTLDTAPDNCAARRAATSRSPTSTSLPSRWVSWARSRTRARAPRASGSRRARAWARPTSSRRWKKPPRPSRGVAPLS